MEKKKLRILAGALIIGGVSFAVYLLIMAIGCTDGSSHLIEGCMSYTGHPFIASFILGIDAAVLGVITLAVYDLV